jgi:drug/metabolite transporter (DMT)-like permease
MGSGSYTFMLIIATPILTGNLKLLEPLFGSIMNFILGFGNFPSPLSILGSIIVGVGIYYLTKGYEIQELEDRLNEDILEMQDSNVIYVP